MRQKYAVIPGPEDLFFFSFSLLHYIILEHGLLPRLHSHAPQGYLTTEIPLVHHVASSSL